MSEDILATPDGRYLVVRGRLWRLADPSLPTERKQALVMQLMEARRGLRWLICQLESGLSSQ